MKDLSLFPSMVKCWRLLRLGTEYMGVHCFILVLCISEHSYNFYFTLDFAKMELEKWTISYTESINFVK